MQYENVENNHTIIDLTKNQVFLASIPHGNIAISNATEPISPEHAAAGEKVVEVL